MIPLIPQIKSTLKNLVESRHWPRRPESLNFEITAACDAECIHCPRLEMDRAMRVMPRELFHRLVDEAAEMQIPSLYPNGYGEICTLPVKRLAEYLEYITSRTSHKFRIFVNTNGNMMDEARIDLFIKHRVHSVNVTIDGATAATAESIRRKLSFERIEENIHLLLRKRREAGKSRPWVRVGMVAMAETIPEIPAFLERWHGVADFVGCGGFSSRLASVASVGSIDSSLVQIVRPSSEPSMPGGGTCVLPFRDLNIWADGRAVLCCEDWNEEHVIGDLRSESLSEIWHGARMRAVRELHKRGEGGKVEICAKCDHWMAPDMGARLWS